MTGKTAFDLTQRKGRPCSSDKPRQPTISGFSLQFLSSWDWHQNNTLKRVETISCWYHHSVKNGGCKWSQKALVLGKAGVMGLTGEGPTGSPRAEQIRALGIP